jgi:outer membrane protein OmpA-like peptidoglycan-associated protein
MLGGFSLDRFEPSTMGSDWFASESLDLRGHRRMALGGVLDYAMKPLVAYDAQGREQLALVSDQLFLHLGGSYVLRDRYRISLSLPLLLLNAGTEVVTAGGTYDASRRLSLGDLRLGGDWLLLGEYGKLVSLAAGLQVFFPTGNRDAFASDGTLRAEPRLMVSGDFGLFTYAAGLGVMLRPHELDYAGSALGSELTFSTAAGVRLLERALVVGPELYGATGFRDPLASGTTPLELLLGGHYRLPSGLDLGLAAGPGLTEGLGTPALRVVGTAAWMPPITADRDRDGDGWIDRADLCVDVAAGARPDSARPGCPSPDRDGDGFIDAEDICPDLRGSDPNPGRRGCPPEPPRPQPKPDQDRDGISDDVDACPTEVGFPDPNPKANGCPRARVDTEAKQIRILQRIEFDYDQVTLRASSAPILDAVRKILVEHPEIARVEIQGHSDNLGGPEYNLGLSQRRADAVRLWLFTHGIAPARLRAVGYGETRPIDTNDTAQGRQNNRRVEFHIELTESPSAPGGGEGASTAPAVPPALPSSP